MPWISDTTAMIEVTATMLPSTIMNDRSLLAQIDESARPIASRNLFMAPVVGLRLLLGGVVGSASRTSSPSCRSRTELNGPVMTWSPTFTPVSTSK